MFVNIVFTKHALKKFIDLTKLKIYISKSQILNILEKPMLIDEVSDFPSKIATGMLDKTHILRIVYREEDGTIVVITFYPGKKERYL